MMTIKGLKKELYFEVQAIYGDSQFEKLCNLYVREIDHNGDIKHCYGFQESPSDIQDQILKSLDLTWEKIFQIDEIFSTYAQINAKVFEN